MSPKRREVRRGRASVTRSAPVFAALGDTRRLWILARLSEEGPLSIARLSSGAEVTRQAIAKHLRVLSAAGLVRGERRGRERLFRVEPDRLEEAHRDLAAMSTHWEAAIERLRRQVDG